VQKFSKRARKGKGFSNDIYAYVSTMNLCVTMMLLSPVMHLFG
jgi:hypothetical protein